MAKNKGLMIGCGVGAVIVVIIIGFVLWGVSIYNNLITLEEGVNQSWAQVENVYQRRADLVPNLVNTVKGAADFEKETFTAVTEARAKVNQINVTQQMLEDPQAFQMFQSAQDELGSALSRLIVTVENYPQLNATANFQDLQQQLEGTENRISIERKKFNEAVQSYNTTIRRFPANFIAGMAGFNQKQYFQAAEGAETVPEVQF